MQQLCCCWFHCMQLYCCTGSQVSVDLVAPGYLLAMVGLLSIELLLLYPAGVR
jgi:hypothetical protein